MCKLLVLLKDTLNYLKLCAIYIRQKYLKPNKTVQIICIR